MNQDPNHPSFKDLRLNRQDSNQPHLRPNQPNKPEIEPPHQSNDDLNSQPADKMPAPPSQFRPDSYIPIGQSRPPVNQIIDHPPANIPPPKTPPPPVRQIPVQPTKPKPNRPRPNLKTVLKPLSKIRLNKDPQLKVKRSFVIFSFATFFVVVVTIILGIIGFWPYLSGLFENKSSKFNAHFQDALAKSLQVQNQSLKVELSEKQIASIIPQFNGGKISQARIDVTSNANIEHLNQPVSSQIDAKMRFDFIIQQNNQSSNFVLDVSVLFKASGQVFLKIDHFSLNDQQFIADSNILNRWTSLTNVLNDQQIARSDLSKILNYAVVFIERYNPYHVLVLLPMLNISNSQTYLETKDILSKSQAYDFNGKSCLVVSLSKWRCQLRIDYDKLYNFYEKVYKDVFKQDLPSFYNYLKTQDLPNEFDLIFDIDRQQFSSISNIKQDGSNLDFNLVFESFDDFDFELRQAQDLLDIIEYNRQLVEIENGNVVFDN